MLFDRCLVVGQQRPVIGDDRPAGLDAGAQALVDVVDVGFGSGIFAGHGSTSVSAGVPGRTA